MEILHPKENSKFNSNNTFDKHALIKKNNNYCQPFK